MLEPMPGALVTGAGGGIGLAVARRLAGRGYSVAVTDIDGGMAERAATGIGERAWPLALDVTDAEACRRAAAEVAEKAGTLDVWVNNAGILLTGLVYEQDAAAHRKMLEVNAVGTFNGTLAALELMRPRGSGDIINVVSLAGLVAAPGEVAYSASKHAAMAFTIGTLADLRRSGVKDIHLSALCPDGVWTPMLQHKLDDPDAAASWSGVMLTPERIADAAESLLDRPRPVLTVPRWRGALIRVFDSFPGLANRLIPLLMKDARRKQRRFARKLERQQAP
jgi:NAD(P)-dependent dehydrogenase (short-subunit alcohol dehydrogenase family)